MRTLLVSLTCVLTVFLSSAGSQPAKPDFQPLWPKEAPAAKGTTAADIPGVYVHLPPADKATGTAIVICPGGGYQNVAIDHEGHQVAQWLNQHGVAGIVLKYRLGPKYNHPVELGDAQRALRYVRAHAKEWHIDPQRVGIMGFSAGGHLASTTGTHFDPVWTDANDPIDMQSLRPDFMVLLYPVIRLSGPYAHVGSRNNLLGKTPAPELVESLNNDKQVTAKTPPTFLAHTSADNGVPPQNSVEFYLALVKNKVPAELHVYEKGKHGLGLGGDTAFASWTTRCLDWMKGRGLLERKSADSVTVHIDSPMPAPRWAELERKLLDENLAACREFYQKYIDDRGYLKCIVRWGANDGPDDAPENFNRWPELHALGADDEILSMYCKGWEGHLKQYTEAKTIDVPIARQGMYYKEFISQFDWMHNGEGLQLFNRMGLSVPLDAKYQDRARRFAGFYMGEDPVAANYDPQYKIIRSMMNGSRGPMLRKATALDWAGDPFDLTGFTPIHRERNYQEFLDHYAEYTDVVGDHFLNLVATTLPMNAYMLSHEEKYRRWILDYMDAWLDRMKQNNGIIPSKIGLDGKIGGDDGKWWGNAYGWGFSPVNPTNGRRENRNRIPRGLVGFNNALWVSGDQKYLDAWRNLMDAVNANARTVNGKKQYPTMYGDQGWYGWSDKPWNVGALELWYWSMKPDDLKRVPQQGWVSYLQGKNPTYPVTALERDLQSIRQKVDAFRKDNSTPDKRLSDNMLHLNPAAAGALIQLMLGGLPPSVDGGLLNARLRYFDPERRRAGIPKDVAALVTEMSDTHTTVTLVNLSKTQSHTMIVQGGAYGEHQLESVMVGDKTSKVQSPLLTIRLEPGCGQRLVLQMKRYANKPTVLHPWHREASNAVE
jgi:acetyl esterase/lipase